MELCQPPWAFGGRIELFQNKTNKLVSSIAQTAGSAGWSSRKCTWASHSLQWPGVWPVNCCLFCIVNGGPRPSHSQLPLSEDFDHFRIISIFLQSWIMGWFCLATFLHAVYWRSYWQAVGREQSWQAVSWQEWITAWKLAWAWFVAATSISEGMRATKSGRWPHCEKGEIWRNGSISCSI